MHLRRLLLAAVAGSVLLGSCGSTTTTTSVDPNQLLRDAKASIDAATSVHFTLSSQNAGGSGTVLSGGHGDAVRPNSFSGQINVLFAGLPINVDVISVGGTFYARTPLSPTYAKTDPSAFGFGDPAKLLDPATGLSSLLTSCTGATMQDADRVAGEQLSEVRCSMKGAQVAALLTSADPAHAVQATIGVTPDAHQLRRVVLVGPFFSATQMSTFTVVLANYGEKVSVTPPAG